MTVPRDEYAEFQPLRARLARVPSLDAAGLAAERIAVLGRKGGELTALLKSVATLDAAGKRAFGAAVNELKREFESAFEARAAQLADEARARESAGVDLTMPGRGRWIGAAHPVTRVIDEIVDIFRELGFSVAGGPEAETEWYNFGALNFPADHPAMDMHDTLYLDCRGHRGAGRAAAHAHPHVAGADSHAARVGAAGARGHPGPRLPERSLRRLARAGLHPARGAGGRRGHLVRGSQGHAQPLRPPVLQRRYAGALPPVVLPFTEPSAEMDVGCQLCGGTGCAACKGTGWMEILGCGMVHPKVLENCGVDAERHTGFAFGMGPHRIAMLRYGIPDIRLLYEGDMRFLAQLAGGR